MERRTLCWTRRWGVRAEGRSREGWWRETGRAGGCSFSPKMPWSPTPLMESQAPTAAHQTATDPRQQSGRQVEVRFLACRGLPGARGLSQEARG